MKLATALAVLSISLSTTGAVLASDTIVSEGFVHSAPAQATATTTIKRNEVAAQGAAAVRTNIEDPIAAEGRGMIQSQSGSTRSRAQVRNEAIAAVQRNIQDPIAAAGERPVPRGYAPVDVTVSVR